MSPRSPRSHPPAAVNCIEISVDRMLRKRLRKNFRERGLISSKAHFEDFLRAPENSEQKSIITPIFAKLNPALGSHISKKKLRKTRSRSFSLWILGVLASFHESVKLLVSSGVDVNKLYTIELTLSPLYLRNKTPILRALFQMDPSPQTERLMRLVVDHGADLEARDRLGETILFCAVKYDRVLVAKMLLERGADVNVLNNVTQTPLMFAASSRKARVLLPLLIKHGADVSARDKIGGNVLHRLSRGYVEHVDLARDLIERGASVNSRSDLLPYEPIHFAVMNRHKELVKLYLDHGADVHSPVRDGVTPLHLAARAGNSAMLKTLHERGADINRRTSSEGRTPLHVALMQTMIDEEPVRLLLSAGANVLAEDNDGKTPFTLANQYVCHMSKPETRLMVRKLALIKVCRPSVVLKDERTIEKYPACSRYYRDCIEELERAKSARFIERCTLFDLLTKCHCQIAGLMRNPHFAINFKKYDTTEFSMYAEEMARAFERAEKHYQSMIELEEAIDEAVNGRLPDLIVRKVAYYVLNCCHQQLLLT